MSAEAIYQREIMALANEAAGEGSLPSPDARAFLDNPLCGDAVEMQLTLADGRITALAHQVQGCLLCRAAASIIGKRAIGATAEEIEAVTASVTEMLEKQAPAPAGWPELDVFAPVRAHRSRHRCVELPFDALIGALRSPPAA